MKNGLITMGAAPNGSTVGSSDITTYIFNVPAAVATWSVVVMSLMLMTVATWIVKRPINVA